jgi:cell division GTPase FtsZ
MSQFASLYRRGLISMVTGPTLVVVGFATGIRLMALAGVAVLGWGVYRFIAARGTAR